MKQTNLKPGDGARIRPSIHSPYSGRSGIVLQVDRNDAHAPYLILFNDGLQYRYKADEIESLGGSPHSAFIGTMQRMVHMPWESHWWTRHLH